MQEYPCAAHAPAYNVRGVHNRGNKVRSTGRNIRAPIRRGRSDTSYAQIVS